MMCFNYIIMAPFNADVCQELDVITTTNIEAVKGFPAYLPCDTTPPISSDRVTLVIWYKQGQSLPIYSYDVRRSVPIQAYTSNEDAQTLPNGVHWADDKTLGGRAYFRVTQQPAVLILTNIGDKDTAVYKCRVDFKKSPTRNSKVNLIVIIPPDQVNVYNEKGDQVPDYILGPYKEGDTVDISCIASGGRPLPRVTWWQENALIDETFESLPDNKVKNVLRLERLERRHLNLVFTCQASNNHLLPPVSSAVTLDMILRPLSIKLIGNNHPLSTEVPVNISCQVTGAKPPPIITWWKDAILITDAKQLTISDGNITTSVLTFTPHVNDLGKTIRCCTENNETNKIYKHSEADHLSSSVDVDTSDGWKLNIYHKPIVKLQLGHDINSSAIQEGMDVYFECIVKSNPWIYKVTWRHNGKLLNNSPEAGIKISNQTLVLQKVSRSQAGIYTCIGSNQKGEGESDSVTLDVKYAPVCRLSQETVQGVGRREVAKVLCEVEANPSDNVQFTWRFNNSRETVQLNRDHYTEEGPSSTATYTPLTPLDYGTLMCWAKNEIGKQNVPCVYQIIAAGRPDSMENCLVVNQTSASLMVQCQPGFDGGLNQRFVMEVYDHHGQSLAGNVTADRPAFTINNLPSGLGFDISVYAYNSHGLSDPVQLHTNTLKSAEKRIAVTAAIFHISPTLGIIIIGCMVSVIAVAYVVAKTVNALRKRNRRCRRLSVDAKTAIFNDDEVVNADDVAKEVHGDDDHQRTDQSEEGLEKNPDIIPHDNNNLDEDEKAFERLNSNRMYSTRSIAKEDCKQQMQGLLPPLLVPAQGQHVQYVHYASHSPSGSMYHGPLPQAVFESAAAVYPHPMCQTPPPQHQQIVVHQQQLQRQQHPVPMMRNNHNHHEQTQYAPVDQFQGVHYYQPQVQTMTLGRYHPIPRHRQDRSVEIPLLPVKQPTQHHQRESTV